MRRAGAPRNPSHAKVMRRDSRPRLGQAGGMADLSRFHAAQAGVIDTALAELRAGRKRTHWMWFVFPQLKGLGRSATAEVYGIDGLDEARAYLADPVLSARLTAAARAMLGHAGRPAGAVLGPVDALKLRSSATLFRAAGGGPEWAALLEAFHGGEACAETLRMLNAPRAGSDGCPT
jgi:uncharacterized protein (DUF1810 family)